MPAGIAAWLDERWGRFVGPEATPAENGATAVGAVLGLAVSRYAARRHDLSPQAATLALALAADLWGGLVANNTRSCARWYERPGQGAVQHLAFAAAHLHPFLVLAVDPSRRGRGNLWWAAAHYGYLLAATALVRLAPAPSRRVLGVVTTAAGIALGARLGRSSVLPWFEPVYYGKLLFGHASAAVWSDEVLGHHGPTRNDRTG